MQDEELHEIQLNGKQLVFLFMAATVVAVVIFLCGVMVGRGVPAPRGALIADARDAGADPTAVAQEASPVSITGSDNTPVTVGETLTYTERLEDPNPVAETLKPAAEPAAATAEPAPLLEPAVAKAPAPVPATRVAAAPAVVAPKTPVAKPPVAIAPKASPPAPASAAAAAAASAPERAPAPAPATSSAPTAADTTAGEPAGNGFVVQVAAVRTRTDADAMARRLSAKGYPAFVTTSGANFRVRVGKYDDRHDAESVAGRLEKEEQFKPWITR
jgi:cell division septation protein DedD